MWQVNTPRISARLIWAISEHIDIEGLDPLLADDPTDPLNVIVSNIHKVLFNIDSSAESTNRVQDVQAVLLAAQRLGSRHPRAGQLLAKELEEFRNSTLADSVSKHQCRFMLQRIKYASSHPESRWEYSAKFVFSTTGLDIHADIDLFLIEAVPDRAVHWPIQHGNQPNPAKSGWVSWARK